MLLSYENWTNLPRSPCHNVVRVLLKFFLDCTVELVKRSETLQVERGFIDLFVNLFDFDNTLEVSPNWFY
jgi:hypothetical protein